MKKIALGVLASMLIISPVLAASPSGVAIEPILSVSSDNHEFLAKYAIFQEYTEGGSPVSRAETAKILLHYLQKSEGETAFADRADHTYQCAFTDISKLDADTQNLIKNSCSHGLFKGNSKKFRPNDNLTRAEMLTILSRMTKENIQEGNPRWEGYYTAALAKDRITATDISKMNWNITKENFAKLLYAYDSSRLDTNPVDTNEPDTNELANTARKLQLFDGQTVTGDYTLTFTEDTLHTAFCNNINGTYTIDENTLNADLIQTEMACLEGESMTLEGKFNLTNATFTIASTRMLTNTIERLAITTAEDHTFTYIKTWEPADPNARTPRDALDGKEFWLRSLNGIPTTGTYLIMFAAGTLSTKFCNNINGSYSISEENKMSGTLISTLMACLDEETTTLEEKFIIEDASVAVDGDEFTLTTKNNDLFVRHAIYR